MPLIGSNVCSAHVRWKNVVADDSEGRPPKPALEGVPFQEEPLPSVDLVAITDSREFAKAVLESEEFRRYIVNGLIARDIPATLIIRLMDYAEGWGKPPERVEHTGKDGQPIVTEVRRVIISVNAREEETIDALPPVTAREWIRATN